MDRRRETPAELRAALDEIPPPDRDAWVDRMLGLGAIVDDGPELPRGCVPYLPCPVDVVLRAIDLAQVSPSDVFVDIGAGVGRVAVLVHLLTGAATIGIEIQSSLVRAAIACAVRLDARASFVHGDASCVPDTLARGSVFFLYCPFSGARLERVLDHLEAVARTRTIRVCTVDLPLPPRAWLSPVSPVADELVVWASRAV